MLLTWEYKRVFTDGTEMDFAHEPDGLFVQYFRNTNRLNNKSTKSWHDAIDYENTTFHAEAKRITAQSIDKWGLKALPQFGAYAFFTSKYGNNYRVLMPLNYAEDTGDAPAVSCTQTSTLDFTITGTNYECYKVIMRLGNFATEYTSYERTFSRPLLAAGSYSLSVIGYNPGGENSLESEPTTKVIT